MYDQMLSIANQVLVLGGALLIILGIIAMFVVLKILWNIKATSNTLRGTASRLDQRAAYPFQGITLALERYISQKNGQKNSE